LQEFAALQISIQKIDRMINPTQIHKALAVDAEQFKDLYLDIVSARQEDGKNLTFD
jgi:hypothetical protein